MVWGHAFGAPSSLLHTRELWTDLRKTTTTSCGLCNTLMTSEDQSKVHRYSLKCVFNFRSGSHAVKYCMGRTTTSGQSHKNAFRGHRTEVISSANRHNSSVRLGCLLDVGNCNTLLGVLIVGPLLHKRGSGRRLTEPHSSICSWEFVLKISSLLLKCLFFQLVDKFFSVHLEEWDRVLKENGG